MRTLRSKWHEEGARPETPPFPHSSSSSYFAEVKRSACDRNTLELMTEAVGQGVNLVTTIEPEHQMVMDMIEEAYAVFDEITGEEESS